MQLRRHQIILASTVIAAMAAAPAAAQEPGETGSEAGATAVEVDDVVAISSTEASTYGDGSAEANVLELGGEPVVGGSQEGTGENSGEILTTGEDNDQGYLTIGGWQATVEDDRSYANSSVADGNLGGEDGISGTVLESESEATENDGSRAETTGVRVRLGPDLELELLHANTSSDGEGESYILAINGEQVFSSEQADGQCEIAADPLAHLLCLYAEATEGEGGLTGGNAGVLDAALLDENITGRLFDAEASAGPGDDAVTPTPAGGEEPQPAPDDGGDEVEPAGTLPRTGGGLFAGLWGLLALGAGEGLRRTGRR